MEKSLKVKLKLSYQLRVIRFTMVVVFATIGSFYYKVVYIGHLLKDIYLECKGMLSSFKKWAKLD